jgi:orotate phosphoribosyltransferase
MNIADVDGKILTKFNSWLVVNKQSNNDRYINAFCDFIKKTFVNTNFYLVITGDLTDSANIDEFKEIRRILDKIVMDLSIEKDCVLIIPGDHDVNRIDAVNARTNDSNNKIVFDYNVEKFEKFSSFYALFYNYTKEFNAETAISDVLLIEESKILYLGLNSNFHIGAKSGKGYIDPIKFENEIKVLDEKYNDSYTKIACFHHNFIPFFKEEDEGQWEPENLYDIKRLFEIYKIDCYLYGNEHTPHSELKANIPNISIGSFGIKSPNSTFNLLKINNTNYVLENNLCQLSNYNVKNVAEFGTWDLNNNSCGQIDKIDLKTPSNELPLVFSDQLPSEAIKNQTPVIQLSENYIPFDNRNNKHKELLRIIKSKNLFHSGHFHWSETSRAHGWIDVSKLLGDKDNLNKCKKYINETLTLSSVKFDFIIGLGVEGNMLATRTAILSSKPYSFLPYSYRYDDHSKFEKQLNFENEGKFKSVVIITDVVHDGRTIRKLIHKKRDDDITANFFLGVEKITVISLFYTGKLPDSKDQYHDQLNKYDEDENFDKENDHLEDRIEFHFVSHIRVEECPYNKNNYKSDCIIVKEGLGCIHKFYTEKPEI